MSCGPCNCDDCLVDRLEKDPEPPIPRPRWEDAEKANPIQALAWGGVVDKILTQYKRVNLPTCLHMVAAACNVRPENYTHVSLQIERFIRENPSYALYKGKSGGLGFKTEETKSQAEMIKDRIQAIKPGTLPAPIHNVVAVTVSDNYTCKGCGNTKLNSKEKSCWKCGRTVGT